jgi:hypothetical protein
MRPLLALAFALLASGASAQTMYKCVDARGTTRYTDRPEPGCKGKEVNIQGQPPISGTLTPKTEDFSNSERDFQRRRIDEERVREAQKNTEAKREQQCAQLQSELSRLQSGVRLVRPDDKGGYEYVEDEERNQQAERLRAEIAQRCR